MQRKFLGFCYSIFGLLCFYFSSYWYFYYTDMCMKCLISQYSYFTNQTIVLCGIYFCGVGLIYMGCRSLEKFIFNCYIKVAIMTYVFMVSIGYYTGVVRFCTVTWEELYVVQPQSIFMHLVVPVVTSLFYNTTPFRGRVQAAKAINISFYPIVYLFYASAYSMVTNEYIYPILNPQIMGYGLEIPFYILLGCGIFWIIGFLVASRYNFCIDQQENHSKGDI